MEILPNIKKADKLVDFIQLDMRLRFLPFLLSLVAAKQIRILREMDTVEIRACLNLKSRGLPFPIHI